MTELEQLRQEVGSTMFYDLDMLGGTARTWSSEGGFELGE